MRKSLALAIMAIAALFAALAERPASAQVEPRFAGDWQCPATAGEPAKSWHIGADGRYQTKVDGRVVESGKFFANNGSWTLKSDSGRSDSGTFSFIGGSLKMGGGLSGAWNHDGNSAPTSRSSTPPAKSIGTTRNKPAFNYTPSQTPSSTSTYTPSKSPAYNPSYTALTNTSGGQPPVSSSPAPAYTPPPSASNSTATGAANSSSGSVWGDMGSNGGAANAGGRGSAASVPPQSSDSAAGSYAPQGRPRTLFTSEHLLPTKRHKSYSWDYGWNNRREWHPEDNRRMPAQGGPPPSSSTYTNDYNNGQRPPLPGYAPGNNSSRAYDPNSSLPPDVNGGPPTTNSMQRPIDFNTWSRVQWANRGNTNGGLQRVPKGGYIPVMKDNKARKFFGH